MPTVHYLNRRGAKSYTMKSGKNSQIMMNLSKMNYFFGKFFKMYSNIIIWKVLWAFNFKLMVTKTKKKFNFYFFFFDFSIINGCKSCFEYFFQ